MVVRVKPFTTEASFNGSIYTVNASSDTGVSDSACNFKTNAETGLTSLAISFVDLREKCGGIWLSMASGAGDNVSVEVNCFCPFFEKN